MPRRAATSLRSLGALLYRATTGRCPFNEATREATLAAMLTRSPEALRASRPQIPEAFEAMVMKSLARDPASRFASADEVGRALLPFASAGARDRWAAEFGFTSVPAPVLPTRTSTRPPPPPAAEAPLRPSVPISPEARRTHIRRMPVFSALSTRDLDDLLACLRWRTLAPGDTLYRQGDLGETMAFITEGTVAVLASSGATQHELARLSVGSAIGEMACLDPAPRSATVTSVDDVVVAELSRDGLDALSTHAPGVAALLVGEVIRNVAVKVRGVNERIDAVLAPPDRAGRSTPTPFPRPTGTTPTPFPRPTGTTPTPFPRPTSTTPTPFPRPTSTTPTPFPRPTSTTPTPFPRPASTTPAPFPRPVSIPPPPDPSAGDEHAEALRQAPGGSRVARLVDYLRRVL
ncbi:MAG: cyclic nucleotide-binding domain-containing protein [Polyangiales bacterium]